MRPAGTAETGVVWLITQRSQVQILPPLPSSSSEASSDHGGGLLYVDCKRICKPAPVQAQRVPRVPAFRAAECVRPALSVARLLRSGCGSHRGSYLRALRHTELGQYRRDVVVDCLWWDQQLG